MDNICYIAYISTMERERPPYEIELTGIVINLMDQVIEFEDRFGTVGCLRFAGETILYEGQPLLLKPSPTPDVSSTQLETDPATDPST
jgi:hypothetical protein